MHEYFCLNSLSVYIYFIFFNILYFFKCLNYIKDQIFTSTPVLYGFSPQQASGLIQFEGAWGLKPPLIGSRTEKKILTPKLSGSDIAYTVGMAVKRSY